MKRANVPRGGPAHTQRFCLALDFSRSRTESLCGPCLGWKLVLSPLSCRNRIAFGANASREKLPVRNNMEKENHPQHHKCLLLSALLGGSGQSRELVFNVLTVLLTLGPALTSVLSPSGKVEPETWKMCTSFLLAPRQQMRVALPPPSVPCRPNWS